MLARNYFYSVKVVSFYWQQIQSIVKDEKYEEMLPGSVFNVLEDMMDQDLDL